MPISVPSGRTSDAVTYFISVSIVDIQELATHNYAVYYYGIKGHCRTCLITLVSVLQMTEYHIRLQLEEMRLQTRLQPLFYLVIDPLTVCHTNTHLRR